MVFEEENLAKGSVDKEVMAHMLNACILRNDNIREDLEYFWNTLRDIERIAQHRLESLEQIR